MNQKERDEFIEQNGDCPELLIKMARTKWQKAVAIEFVRQARDTQEVKSDLRWIKYLVVSIFGLAVLGVLSQWFPLILKAFGL